MKYYNDKTVLEAAKERINFLFDEFEDIYVAVSGGKDSTVALYVTLEVARERGRRIGLYFLDQEFEYESTVELMREWMALPDVDPYWCQFPLKMYNANSAFEPFTIAWGEERRDTWMREREPYAITENFGKSDRFHKTLNNFTDWRQSVTGLKTCMIGGMRCEESFNRFRAMTTTSTYRTEITWGRKNKDTYTFYPFYDWSQRDVWKYICDNGLKYNTAYDKFYQLGFTLNNMRVSNLIHEFTHETVMYLQEIEPRTYEKLTAALPGISTTAKFMEDFLPKELPEMFSSWKEYRDYLLETIVAPEYRDGFRKVWSSQVDDERIHRLNCIECIKSDVTHTVNKDRTKKLNAKIRIHNTEKIKEARRKARMKKGE